MVAVYGLAGLFFAWLAVMFYRVWRMVLAGKAAGGCGAREWTGQEVAGASDGNCCAGGGSNSAQAGRLAVLVQDQADGVEGLVHRLVAGLSCSPDLLIALVDGGSSDETGLILERLARLYNLEFYRLTGGGPEIDRWPVRCLDLRGLSCKDLLNFDLAAMT